MAILKAVLNLLRVQYNGAEYLVTSRVTVSHLGPRYCEGRRNGDARGSAEPSSGAERVSGESGIGTWGEGENSGTVVRKVNTSEMALRNSEVVATMALF